MKNASQITFEFQEPTEAALNSGVGARIKSLKKGSEDTGKEKETSESKPTQESLFPEISAVDAQAEPVKVLVTPDTAQPVDLSEAAVPVAEQEILHTANAFATGEASMRDEEVLDFSASAHENAGLSNADSVDTIHYAGEAVPVDVAVDDSLQAADLQGPEVGGINPKTKSTRGRKSLKTIDDSAELINIPPDEQLFQKQYYSIGEVAEMFHVNQSLLRFWETEFDIIQPRKNRKGDRHFRPIDIKNLLLIHDPLRRRKLTIEGAKDFLKKNKRSPERFAMIQSLQRIKGFILEIKATL